MASNYQKLWIQKNLNQVAINQAAKQIEQQGSALPCHVVAVSGSIVTVAFDVQGPWTLPRITIPKAESPWIRMPTQVGDKGMTIPSDAYLGGISGLGGGTASMTRTPGNLSALVFVPVSSLGSPPSNQNAAIVQGPDGAIIQTTSGTASSIVVNSSGITMTFGSTVVTINASGVSITGNTTVTGTLGSTGNMTAGSIDLQTHYHSGVTTGSGNTGGPSG